MPVSILDFYFPSPRLGEKYSVQLPEFRTNSTSLAAIVKSAYQDQDLSPSQQHALAGLAFGEQTFNKRYRVFYDSSGNFLKIQFNTGTAINPTWTDYLSIRDLDGRVTILGSGGIMSAGGFYGLIIPPSSVTFKESESGGFSKQSDTLVVDSNVFYLTSAGNSKPLLSLRDISGVGEVNTASNLGGGTGLFAQKLIFDLQFKSLVAGTNITLSNTASTVTITSTASSSDSTGFYGVIFKESKAGGRLERDDILVLDTNSGFYLSQAGDDRKPLLSFHDHIESISSTSTGDQSLLSTETVVGAGHRATVKKLTAGTNITLSSDSNQITINSTASGSVSSPGFYGIVFKESKTGGRVERDDTLVFDNNSGFYLTQAGDDGKPLLAFRDYVGSLASTSTGDQSLISADTATGSTHSITTKKLTAGTNITLSSDSNQITINSSVSGSTSPGFYGVVLKESKSGGRIERDDTIVFDSLSGFYLTQAGDDGKPLLAFRDYVGSLASTSTGDATLISADSATGSSHTVTVKKLTAGTNITFSTDSNQITINAVAAASSPGFYGIVFRESRAGSRKERDDTLVFDSNFFYLTQAGDDGKPLLSFISTGSGGETNTASNLGAGTGVFAQKSGVDLQFKSLVAGENIIITNDSTSITFKSVKDPGFYGITVGETDGSPNYKGINTVKFDSQYFYLLQNADTDTSIISLRPPPAGAGSGSSSSSSITLLNTYTPSAASTVDIVSQITSAYEFYKIVFRLRPTTDDVELWIRTDDANGLSFDLAATDYDHVNNGLGPAYGLLVSSGTTAMKIGDTSAALSVGNATGEHITGTIHFQRGSTTFFPMFHWNVQWVDANGRGHSDDGGGFRKSAATINAIQILFESGTIAEGIIKLYGWN